MSSEVSEIRSAVSKIPTAIVSFDPVWTQVFQGLAHEASLNPGQSEELLQVLRATTLRTNVDVLEVENAWSNYLRNRRFRESPTTIQDVFFWARTYGWRGSGPSPTPTVEPARNKFTPIFARDFLALPEPTYVVSGIVPDQAITVVYGQSKHFKSFVVLELAGSVAIGALAFGNIPTAQGDVVVATAEAPFAMARKRWPAWASAHGITNLDRVGFALIPAVPTVSDPDETKALVAEIKAKGIKPKIVVIDTVARAMSGLDENDARAAGMMVAAAEYIVRELQCAVVLVHHCGKDGTKGMRGSSALFAGVDAVFKVTRANDGLAVVLTSEKMKDADEPYDIHLLGEPIGSSLVFKSISASEYSDVSKANPPLSPAEVGRALKAANAIQGVEITTNQLAMALLPTGNTGEIQAIERRLRRGATKQLCAFVSSPGGLGKPTKWMFP